MSRPENVRCETCCYAQRLTEDDVRRWLGKGYEGGAADCRRNQDERRPRTLDYWCGEWRAEWPNVTRHTGAQSAPENGEA